MANNEVIIQDSILIVENEFQELIYQPRTFNTFTNFELNAELMTSPGAIASIVFHTSKKSLKQGYEVRIDNSPPGNWEHLQKTGSLSSIRNIQYNMIEDNTWFLLNISVVENHIKIMINGYPVVDYIEPLIPFRTSETMNMAIKSGTFGIKTLYGHTSMKIKNLSVQKLPKGDISKNIDPDFVKKITELNTRQIPAVDFHVHKKGDLTMEFLLDKSAKQGINYGIAANCGLKFPIQTDEELKAYLVSIEGMPIFKAMQAEGREWVNIFSPELIARFDYAFTDAMTWTNKNGTRMRLWIPEETEVGDPQDFMDQLVAQIEKITLEPISIYVNPTFLPAEIENRYEELWTDERIDKVIAALKENDVALELNDRRKLPGKRFIIKAKKAGIKFAMGTNNSGSEDLGSLKWAIEMIDKYEIQPSDMFIPHPNRNQHTPTKTPPL